MRARHSGIINISSTARIEARPSRTLYSASKFALEAVSEALHQEVQQLGIRVLLVEPGWFRTLFSSAVRVPEVPLPREYEGTIVETMMQFSRTTVGASTPGDVEKGTNAIFEVAMGEGVGDGVQGYLRLPLGKDGCERWRLKLQSLRENMDIGNDAGLRTNLNGVSLLRNS